MQYIAVPVQNKNLHVTRSIFAIFFPYTKKHTDEENIETSTSVSIERPPESDRHIHTLSSDIQKGKIQISNIGWDRDS